MGIHSNSALLSLLTRRLLRALYLNSPRQVSDTYTLVKWFSCSYSNTRSASPVKFPLLSGRKFSVEGMFTLTPSDRRGRKHIESDPLIEMPVALATEVTGV